MPIIADSAYTVRYPWLRFGHFQTIWPTLFRRVSKPVYVRERIATPDDDFFDVDWIRRPAHRLLIVLHGLEGSSQSTYVCGMAHAAVRDGWCIAALNFRGCSGEPNKQSAWYNSGDTRDLHTFIKIVTSRENFSEVALVGFSVGGNIALKYLAEIGASVPLVKSAVVISVPIDLKESAAKLNRSENSLYLRRFIKLLCDKVRQKMRLYPGLVKDLGLKQIRTFQEFDDLYTAPLHGFKDAEDYWANSSSRPLLHRIVVPTLLLSARDDSFLTDACYPFSEAKQSPYLFLETPVWGGHVGFMCKGPEYWSETRALQFIGNAQLEKMRIFC